MSLTTTTNRIAYSGDNSTTVYSFPYLVLAATHITVYLAGVLQVSGYTVGAVGDPAGTTVTFAVAPGSGVSIVILRVVPQTQLSLYTVAGAFPAKNTETNFDLACMRDQQMQETLNRAVTLPVTSTLTAANLPDPALAANFGKGLKVAGDGTGYDLYLLSATPFTSPLTTKGDLAIYGTQADRLAVGANDTILVADSSQAKGAKWSNTGLLVSADPSVALGVASKQYADANPAVVLSGGKLTVTMAANAVTIAVKTNAGSDPSATDPVSVRFRSATLTDSSYVTRKISGALSTVISSGSTGGTIDAVASRIYIGVIDNAGTVELCWWNALTTSGLFGWSENGLVSTTAEGGAGAADSAGVVYSTTARVILAGRYAGYFESTQATAGTWASAATVIQQMGLGVNRTGDILQSRTNTTGAVATGTTAGPNDDTILQITEGDQYISQALTPTNVINRLQITVQAFVAHAAVRDVVYGIFQDSTANAVAAGLIFLNAVNETQLITLAADIVAGTASSTTIKFRAGGSTGATLTFNGFASNRKQGGAMGSYIRVAEVFV